MRVSLLSPYSLSVPGGVQGQVLGLARALRALGVDARVIGPTDGPPPEPGITTVGSSIGFSTNGSISPMAEEQSIASERTLEALRVFEPDVLHLHEPLVPGPTSAALLGSEIPKVGTFHAAGEAGSPAYKALRKLAVGAARRLDVDAFAKVEPTPSPRQSVLFLGRHEPRKGLGVLLDAWTGLDRDAVLWVASDGPETEALRARRTPGVDWLGRISESEKLARLKGATVFCAPALGQESFGIVLLEAMAAGTSVLASDIPGYRNVAHHDVNALMVRPDDPHALRLALRRLLDADDLRARLVEAASAHVLDFSLGRLAQRYLGVYEQAIAANSSA